MTGGHKHPLPILQGREEAQLGRRWVVRIGVRLVGLPNYVHVIEGVQDVHYLVILVQEESTILLAVYHLEVESIVLGILLKVLDIREPPCSGVVFSDYTYTGQVFSSPIVLFHYKTLLRYKYIKLSLKVNPQSPGNKYI